MRPSEDCNSNRPNPFGGFGRDAAGSGGAGCGDGYDGRAGEQNDQRRFSQFRVKRSETGAFLAQGDYQSGDQQKIAGVRNGRADRIVVHRQNRALFVRVVGRLVKAVSPYPRDVVHVDFPVRDIVPVADRHVAFIRRRALRTVVAMKCEPVQRNRKRQRLHFAVGSHHPPGGFSLADVHVAFFAPHVRDKSSGEDDDESVMQQ